MPHTAEAIRLFRAHITESLLSRPDVGNLLLPRRVMLSCYDGATESDPAGMYAAHRDGFAPPTWQDGLEYAAESNSTRNPPLLAISGSYSDRLFVWTQQLGGPRWQRGSVRVLIFNISSSVPLGFR